MLALLLETALTSYYNISLQHSFMSSVNLYLLPPQRLVPFVQHYPWGKQGESSIVARLTEATHDERPHAELWLGSHPSGSALIDVQAGITLRDCIARNPIVTLGTKISAQWSELPFLLKVLSIAQPLSIQAHPDTALAEKLNLKDRLHYPDPHHKPEMGIALTPVDLLYGFKTKIELIDTFTRHPALLDLLPRVVAEDIRSGASPLSEEELRYEAYRSIVEASSAERATATNTIAATLANRSTQSLYEKLIPSLIKEYGADDIGIASALLLKEITLSPGEALYIAPRIPHAYLSGDLIECMAASDNVVRAGLTRKFQDKETLLQMLDYAHSGSGRISPQIDPNNPETTLFIPPISEFQVAITRGSTNLIHAVVSGTPELFLQLEGTTKITSPDGSSLTLTTGQGLFVPACVESYDFEVKEGSLIRVTVGIVETSMRIESN